MFAGEMQRCRTLLIRQAALKNLDPTLRESPREAAEILREFRNGLERQNEPFLADAAGHPIREGGLMRADIDGALSRLNEATNQRYFVPFGAQCVPPGTVEQA